MSLYDYFNSFSRYIEEERPSDKAIVLYWSMLDMFNRRGWPEWTGANKQKLAMMCNTTDRKATERARAALCQAGFLEYRPGEKKGQITQYRLLIPQRYRGKKGEESLPQNAPQNRPEAESGGKKGEESLPQNAPQNAVILIKTKTKTLSSSSSTTTATAQEPRGRLPPSETANPELSRVMKAYGDFLPGASDSSKAKLAEYCQSLGAELCLYAMDVARDAGKGAWQYLNGILYNWKQAGIRSLADLERREEERRRNRNGNYAHGNDSASGYAGRGNDAAGGYASQSGDAGEAGESTSADERWGIRSAF